MDYPRQLLHLRAVEASGAAVSEDELYTERSSCGGRCCGALESPAHRRATVLLVDEIDRADDEFEAFLLEILPTGRSRTRARRRARRGAADRGADSNRTRDVHDALKRRCLYHWISHPDFDRELAILRVRAPEVPAALARQVAAAVERCAASSSTATGVAETIDWRRRSPRSGGRTSTSARRGHAGTILKYRETRSACAPRLPSSSTRRSRAVPERLAPETEREPDRIASRRRILRGSGLSVPVGSVVEYARAFGRVGLTRPAAVYWAGARRSSPVRGRETYDVRSRRSSRALGRAAERCAGHGGRARARCRRPGRRRRRADEEGGRADVPTIAVRWSATRPCAHATSPCIRRGVRRGPPLMADLRLAAALRRSRRLRPSHGSRQARPPAHGTGRAPYRRRADRPPTRERGRVRAASFCCST